MVDLIKKYNGSETNSPNQSTFGSNVFTYDVVNPSTDKIFESKLHQLLNLLQPAENYTPCNENHIPGVSTYPVYTLNQLTSSAYFTMNAGVDSLSLPYPVPKIQPEVAKFPKSIIKMPFEVSFAQFSSLKMRCRT